MNRGQRGARARQAAARRTVPEESGQKAFRVLIAVHRPRYRSRAERAAANAGWEVQSLTNREDPIGLINRKPPHVLILSEDFGRNKNMGYLRAAQRYRGEVMKIIGLYETLEDAQEAAALCDAALAPPWRTADLRDIVAQFHQEMSNGPPVIGDKAGNDAD